MDPESSFLPSAAATGAALVAAGTEGVGEVEDEGEGEGEGDGDAGAGSAAVGAAAIGVAPGAAAFSRRTGAGLAGVTPFCVSSIQRSTWPSL